MNSYKVRLENWKDCGFETVIEITYDKEYKCWHLSWPAYENHKDIFNSLIAAKNYVRTEGSIKTTPRFKWLVL